MYDLRSYLGRHQSRTGGPGSGEARRMAQARHLGRGREQDPRLTWPERELVRQLGTKLYGRRAEVSHE